MTVRKNEMIQEIKAKDFRGGFKSVGNLAVLA
jgi:hypothetical protein